MARPARQEAITAAAAIYLEEKIRIETERMVAAATVDAEGVGDLDGSEG